MKLLPQIVVLLLLSLSGRAQPELSHWQTDITFGVQAGKVNTESSPNSYWAGGGDFIAPVYQPAYYYYYPVDATRNRYGLSIQVFEGYRLNHWLIPGITAGVDWYDNTQLFPVAIGVRGDLLKNERRIMPFYSLESGYGFRGFSYHGNQLHGGWSWSPGVGIRIKTGNKTAYIVSVGYKHQEAKLVSPTDGYTTLSLIETRRYNRLFFRMGFSF